MALALSLMLLACADPPLDPGAADGGRTGPDATMNTPDGGTGVDAPDTPGNDAPVWRALASRFGFRLGSASARSFESAAVDPDGDPLSFRAIGALPEGVRVSGSEIAYDGAGPIGRADGVRIEASDPTGATAVSGEFSIEVTDSSARVPAITRSVGSEPRDGHDGCIAWQSVFLLNDGRIAALGTGNHAPEQSNAVRCIDPVTTPGETRSYELFPWTQDISPPDMYSGRNRYVSNYDNHPSIYLPIDDKILWAGHGVFDIATSAWTHGDREPLTERWDDFVDASASPNLWAVYNPATAWCEELGVGVFFGASGGGEGSPDQIVTIAKDSGGWHLTRETVEGVEPLASSRNSAVCIGGRFYVTGPTPSGNRFYEIDVATRTLVRTRTAHSTSENYPQLVHDTRRNRLVLIGTGVFLYDLDADRWEDVTPEGWTPLWSAMGVYHPDLDAIFYRGADMGADPWSRCFDWHRMEFLD